MVNLDVVLVMRLVCKSLNHFINDLIGLGSRLSGMSLSHPSHRVVRSMDTSRVGLRVVSVDMATYSRVSDHVSTVRHNGLLLCLARHALGLL